MRKAWVFAALAAFLATGGMAAAAECDGVTMPESMTVDGAALTLNGQGIRKATMLKVRVYVAGLYLPTRSGDTAAILAADEPWHLDLRFVRTVGAKDIGEAWEEGFKANAPEQAAALQPRVERMNAWMRARHAGDTLSFTHVPARGLTVSLDDAPAGTIEGDDFAKALLAVWLGQEPPNAELKAGLLGGGCG